MSKERHPTENEVLELILTKASLKRDIFELTKLRFAELKQVLERFCDNLKGVIEAKDSRLEVTYLDLGPYYCQVTIAGDILLFYMHTNVFRFAADSYYWKSGYLQEDERRGFCGVIQVYNFLADSFRYQRDNDLGYMIARLFVNRENHFFVEGKKELGYLFNDFVLSELSESCMSSIVLSLLKYTLEFDLYSPNYDAVQQILVRDAVNLKDAISLRTGKRLGFQFSHSEETSA